MKEVPGVVVKTSYFVVGCLRLLSERESMLLELPAAVNLLGAPVGPVNRGLHLRFVKFRICFLTEGTPFLIRANSCLYTAPQKMTTHKKLV